MRSLLLPLFLAVSCAVLMATGARAQSRDYFTADEVELIRETQDIDMRIMVLAHAVDRRFGVLKVDVGIASKPQKESEQWGPLPEGNRLELLTDIRRILQKAIDDIEDTAAHAGTKMEREIENTSKKDKGDPPLKRALRFLAAAAERYKTALNAELAVTRDQKEKGAILDSLESCTLITAAAAKTPGDDLKKKP
jgi:hypothetical protein